MKYQKYITALLSDPVIDTGNLYNASQSVLNSYVKAAFLKDASIWLLDENGSMTCSFMLDLHNNTSSPFSPMDEQQVEGFIRELDSNSFLLLNSSHATTTSWLSNVNLNKHFLVIAPIYHKGKVVGFLQGRRQNHQSRFDDNTLQFSCALADVFGRVILATQNNKLQQALTHTNLELEQKILIRNAELKKTLEDLKTAQSYLVESEKMAALGELVSGVAHEVNTPLGVAITSHSIIGEEIYKLRDAYEKGTLDESIFVNFIGATLPAHDIAKVNLRRAANLVQEFKQTAANQSHKVLVKFDLNSLIHTIINSLEPMYAPYEVEFTLDIPNNLTIVTYSESIDQILSNLINNSCIHGFQPSDNDHNQIYIKVFIQQNDFIIDYQDNGVGIKDEVAKNIFTPFFTTNRSGGGTGLGLSTIYNLISQRLQGDIRSIKQDASLGAHFQIRLPLRLSIPYQEE